VSGSIRVSEGEAENGQHGGPSPLIVSLLNELSKQGVELWFEGARLRFRAPRGALSAEQRARLAEHRDEAIAALRERAAAELRVAPLSYGQQSLWFVNQEEPESAAYHVAFAAAIESVVDHGALQHAMQALVDRHEILRTTYEVVDGRPSQHVAGTATAVVEVVELPGVDDATLRARIETDYRRPFDLRQGVLRTTLYSRGLADHVLLINAHHIAIDGWSLFLLLGEVRALYAEGAAGTPATLTRPELQYTDYVEWQAKMLAGAEGEKLAGYWQAKLAAPRAEVEVPSDRPRPPRKSVRGATCDFRIDADVTRRLAQLARDRGTTPFVLLLAAFKILLFRYSGTEDIVVGAPMRGRSQPEFLGVLGHFVNAVPLRSQLSAQMRVGELTASLRQTLIEALEGQEYPLALMVERLQPRRDPSRSPLFETTFVLQRFEQFGELARVPIGGPDQAPADFGGLKARAYPLHQEEGQFDLGLSLMDRDDGKLEGALAYNTDLFDAAAVQQLAGHYSQLLRAICDQPDARIDELPLLSDAERARVIGELNDTARQVAPVNVVQRFEQQVARTPDAVALSFEGAHSSYRGLNERANQVAHYLRAAGVGPGVLVGLCLPRSLDLVAVVLAIQKAEGAYVPLDPSFPADRLAYMIEDSGAPVVVTAGQATEGVSFPAQVRVIDLDHEATALRAQPTTSLPSTWRPDDPAYVIYTSGSTGRPKGVVVPQGALANFIVSMERVPGLSSTDVLAAVTTISFDIAGLELYLPLVVGARIELVSRETAADGLNLAALLEACGATVMQATPATWRLLLQADWQGAANFRALCGGEPLPRELAEALLPRVGELWNLYGPTETTVWSTVGRVTSAAETITIGTPIANTQVYVLDANREPVPIGVPGELWIGGAGVATGYHRRPELTAERFVTDPFSPVPGARMYRTGDLGRWRPDGSLQHFGRLDHQVKIRGYRIELGEIEAVLGRHDAIRQAVATVFDDRLGDSRLVAYVVYAPGVDATASELRRYLRQDLPDYMVPSLFIPLDTLPLTPNGKVDRKALPAPLGQQRRRSEVVAPRTEMEQRIAALWTEALGGRDVSVLDNFFDIGGHSLLSLQVIARIEQQVGVRLNPARFAMDTLEQIAGACEQPSRSADLVGAPTRQIS
jgi:amino acid adenylation domain-containing protein